MKTVNVMIVDDHPLVCIGYSQLIETEPDLSVCCMARTSGDALKMLPRCLPEAAIIDLSLPDGSGLDLIRRILAKYPNIMILVSSMHDENLFAGRSLQAGAKGYINKQEACEKVIIAIRQILKGEIYLSAPMRERLITQVEDITDLESSPIERLSNRELEIYGLTGQGMPTSEIAAKLHLSIKTIESHRANIKAKLGLHSAGELIRSAVQWTLETH